jgi:hypothetical protein
MLGSCVWKRVKSSTWSLANLKAPYVHVERERERERSSYDKQIKSCHTKNTHMLVTTRPVKHNNREMNCGVFAEAGRDEGPGTGRRRSRRVRN